MERMTPPSTANIMPKSWPVLGIIGMFALALLADLALTIQMTMMTRERLREYRRDLEEPIREEPAAEDQVIEV